MKERAFVASKEPPTGGPGSIVWGEFHATGTWVQGTGGRVMTKRKWIELAGGIAIIAWLLWLSVTSLTLMVDEDKDLLGWAVFLVGWLAAMGAIILVAPRRESSNEESCSCKCTC